MRTAALTAIGALLLARPALACSFTAGYEPFRLGAALRLTTTLAPAPEIAVERIERGYDDGDRGSCSDVGVLVLQVPSDALGYRFEVVAGAFDGVVFPDGFVRTVQRGRLRFIWLDGGGDWQERIEVLVKVTTITSDGVPSEPAVLRIRHPGGANPRELRRRRGRRSRSSGR